MLSIFGAKPVINKSMTVKIQDPVVVSGAAYDYISEKVLTAGASGVRLSLIEYGCTGFKYCWEYIYSDYSETPDHVTKFENWQLVIDYSDVSKLAGSTIDVKRTNFGEELTVLSPKAAAECGCGESVSFNE